MTISIIGHFGGNKQFNDGQTVKTLNINNGLLSVGIKIYKIDTYYVKHNPIFFLCRLFVSLFKCKKYIVLLSANGRKILFPVLYFFSKILKKQIYHDSIGGRVADEVIQNSNTKKYVKAFESNWVESKIIVEKLKKQQVENVVYIPNFKDIKPLSVEKLSNNLHEPIKFCTFSRVMKEKGIADAINALKQINLNKNTPIAILDIYGPIETSFKFDFEELLKKHNNFCHYKGIIPADKSVEILKEYDLLLFPTYWIGEGFPGTIIDALCAGLPVIARNWKYCEEILTHLKTGLIYDFDKPEKLVDCIKYVIDNSQQICDMKINCLSEAKQYTVDVCLPIILEKLQIGIK